MPFKTRFAHAPHLRPDARQGWEHAGRQACRALPLLLVLLHERCSRRHQLLLLLLLLLLLRAQAGQG